MKSNLHLNKVLLFFTFCTIGIYGCKKDAAELAPQVSLSITEDTIEGIVNKPLVITASSLNGKEFTQEWNVDGKTLGSESQFTFTPAHAGTFVITYKGSNNAGEYTKTYRLEVPVPVVAATAASSKYISKIFEYMPAPGQLINLPGTGSPEQAQKLIGGISNVLTLGAYGGYVIFGFDHSVVNNEGNDLAIYGNPIAGTYEWSEPGIVMVSQDSNGNGLADDAWYELAGSEYNALTTIKNYTITYYNPKGYANVTWKDNQGNTGAVEINPYRTQEYYPLFAANQESISFTGTLLRSTFKQGSISTNSSFSWGYSDSASAGDKYATNQYNGFDISWAVDANGNKVVLKTIDFVKVYTGQNEKGNKSVGEVSTEIKGAVDLGIK